MNANVMSALAEPVRLRMVELLRQRPHTVGEMAVRLQLRQPQASKHLRVLSEAGIVEARAEANRRIYRLLPGPFRELAGWLASFRVIREERFNRLDDYLEKLQGKAAARVERQSSARTVVTDETEEDDEHVE